MPSTTDNTHMVIVYTNKDKPRMFIHTTALNTHKHILYVRMHTHRLRNHAQTLHTDIHYTCTHKHTDTLTNIQTHYTHILYACIVNNVSDTTNNNGP